MTVSISQDRSNPHAYRCANFHNCGTSSSHDPSYVGWVRVNNWTYCCSNKCAAALCLAEASRFLSQGD